MPLNTLEMQKRVCPKLRVSPEAAMKVAEELYQEGILSYPRTETDAFPTDMDLRALVDAQRADARWGAYAGALLGGRFQWPAAGGHDDKAHPPIYPVKARRRHRRI